ncbi:MULTISPECIES: hypothetical protein [unclassified Sphingomonas]|uniref:hypothetical protein n=1 Tax=unclassified Sphingomonas TaxID=196159 RepID=UPI002150A13C|nr:MULTISPECIES: hypothetical protein [unclassified Sphingomonas]MCR5872276.1 hypothetical protein [Sphingomonas sp. J344]UUX99424.1 hypothetical protein LRS08_18595 [Sphingomonas sp. J315]
MRDAQSLPLGWRHLTAVDVALLKEALAKAAAPDADLRTLEGCLLAWATLATGRHPAHLLALSMRMARKSERLAAGVPGLVSIDGRWGWWLLAAAPPGQRNASDLMCPTSPGLYLPATKAIAELAGRCVAMRRRQSAGRVNVSGAPIPLFTFGDALLANVTAILAARHPLSAQRARRATTTPEALARWLPAEMLGAAGGDVVTASIAGGRVLGQGQTAIFYGAVRHEHLVDRYRAAIAPIDQLSHREVPAQLVGAHLGDRLTPSDETVRSLIARLASGLGDPALDAAESHEAMLAYTVALLGFALAHRGNSGTVPSARDVDAGTRLVWIHDKAVSGAPTRRLVWVCDTAMTQLRRYDEHLDQLHGRVSPIAAQAITALRERSGLPLFSMMSGRVVSLTVAQAFRRAFSGQGLPKNAGRHWLRARLVGRCSTESLHALFGHGPSGDGPWDAHSALDPAAYRADLAQVIDPALSTIGWTVRSPWAECRR